jgi:hypothetical protein
MDELKKMKDFFEFGSKLVLSNVQAIPVGLKSDENNLSDHWKLIKGQYGGINFPVIFKQKHGKKFNDILDTGWINLFLISDRMKKILEENKLAGWKTFSIKLYDKKENEIFGYQGFSVTGHCGPINYEKSEIIERRKVPTGPICKFYKGEYVNLDTWDRSDFFIPEGTCQILITKEVAEILKKHKITNMLLENLADKEINIRLVEKRS